MRVTGGVLGGRILVAPPGAATRPTTDKVREALFASLGQLNGKVVADLYAGSGALGFEALSRGAERVCFVEMARAARRALERNAASLGVSSHIRLLPLDVSRARGPLVASGPFDLIFCDPPWTQLERAIRVVAKLPWKELLRERGTMLFEHPSREDVTGILPGYFSFVKTRRWGDTAISVWELDAPEEPFLPNS